MRPLSPFLSPALLTAGAALTAYGGYGAGLVHAAGGGFWPWLQVAAAAASGLGLFAAGLRTRRPPSEPSGSLAADLAALERLVPVVRSHPDGLSSLHDLIDVLFESRHNPAAAKAETLAEKESRRHA